jgi:hypothetical protein
MITSPFTQIEPQPIEDLVRAAVGEIRRAARQAGDMPFDPWAGAIATRVKPRICSLPKGIDGRLRLSADEATIDLSTAASPQRRRFTLCHELAHLCFVERGVWTGLWLHREIEARMAMRHEERACDRVAASLLMPEPIFRAAATRYWQDAKEAPGPSDVLRLAVLFDVSARAAHRRLSELRLWGRSRPKWREVQLLASGQSLGFIPFRVDRNLLYTLSIDSCETVLLS